MTFDLRCEIARLEDKLATTRARLEQAERERDQATARLVEVETRAAARLTDPYTVAFRERYSTPAVRGPM